MSMLLPMRPRDLALVGAWPARREPAGEIAQQASLVLQAVCSLEPRITGWKRSRAKKVVSPDDIAGLTDLVERGAVKDSSHPPKHIREMGYLVWFWPVGVPGVTVVVSSGQLSNRATSTCLVQIEDRLPALRTAEAALRLLRAMVVAFDPEWATWTTPPFGEDDNLTVDGRSLGYLNYGDPDAMRRLDPDARTYARGSIARIGDDPEIRDASPVLRHLRPAAPAPAAPAPAAPAPVPSVFTSGWPDDLPEDGTVLVPIGMPLGLADPPSHAATAFRVRRGRQVHVLHDDLLGAWFLAHTMGHDESSLTSSMRRDGVADPRSAIASLLAGDLLRNVRISAEGALLLAAEHRLVPLMKGFGTDGRGAYTLGVPGYAEHLVDEQFLEVYRRSAAAPTLLAALVGAVEAPGAVTAGLRLDDLAADVLRYLARARLLENGVVALDLGRAS
ncbi:Imm52 family immunity protein [Occultella gossypii]|uniref:Immunity protein 52 domain-containing protein n=1 Tax=Occultella gossypii TaxID=2800820 RepID=A0ABS7S9K0_9MICO|nr:Imm52 family immunity protein [Occultella gossypii]MBZ2197026.1 hypothetical protein [Occultella gossypii]